MKERPILFSAPMVRAILDGKKTQTRRVVKPQPTEVYVMSYGDVLPIHFFDPIEDYFVPAAFAQHMKYLDENLRIKCPYGVPGDRLWVRENFQPLLVDFDKKGYSCLDEANYKTGKGYYCYYTATDGVAEFEDLNSDSLSSKITPSIHMPRWACRTVLEITDVRVERLRDISAEDAKAEGIPEPYIASYTGYETEMCGQFHDLWDSLAKPGAKWDNNPWVWVIEFRKAD